VSRGQPARPPERPPGNIVNDLRDAYVVLNSLVVPRLARQGHGAIRQAHGAVFQHIDDTGTTVSALAERAQITKQSMAELVAHLERHGYVVRSPDPSDGRAKLVRLSPNGREVVAIARGLVPEAERHIAETIGADRLEALRADLQAIRAATIEKYADELEAGRI
jgi:DNA-binding MarR family transcriptional regulator